MLCITETFCRGCQHADSIIEKDSRPLIGYQEVLAILRLNWNSSGGCLWHLPFPNCQNTGKVKRMWELFLLDDLAIECRIIVHRANCRRSPFALAVSEGSSAKLLVPVLDQNVKAITPRRILPWKTATLDFYGGCTSDQFWSSWKSLGQFSKFPKALCFTNVCSLVGKRCSMKGRVGSLWCSGAAPWLRGWILGVSRSTTSSQDRRRGDFQSAPDPDLWEYDMNI